MSAIIRHVLPMEISNKRLLRITHLNGQEIIVSRIQNIHLREPGKGVFQDFLFGRIGPEGYCNESPVSKTHNAFFPGKAKCKEYAGIP